jgi:hypothetical protein
MALAKLAGKFRLPVTDYSSDFVADHELRRTFLPESLESLQIEFFARCDESVTSTDRRGRQAPRPAVVDRVNPQLTA